MNSVIPSFNTTMGHGTNDRNVSAKKSDQNVEKAASNAAVDFTSIVFCSSRPSQMYQLKR